MPKKSSKQTKFLEKNKEQINLLITRIAEEHSKSNKKFGYLNTSDIKNEIWVICLEKLRDFDGERGHLENFLRTVVRNRLINRFKDITKYVRSPCPRCPFYDQEGSPGDCAKFELEKHLCDKWHNYQLSVQSRNSLLNASEQQIERDIDSNVLNKLYAGEVVEIISNSINKDFLYDFNELITGGKVSKQRLKKLKKEIFRILNENNYENTNFVQINVKSKGK